MCIIMYKKLMTILYVLVIMLKILKKRKYIIVELNIYYNELKTNST